MSKVIASVVVAAVMLVGSSALADGIGSGVLHFQDLGTTMLNGITLLGGDQDAHSDNFATIQNIQHSGDFGSCGSWACEDQTAFFNQLGNAHGFCAVIDLDQSILALGTQQQTIGDGVGPKLQQQALTLNGAQMVSKTQGAGWVDGNQIMTLSQDQNAGNPAGPMNQSSTVFGVQNTCIEGRPGATGAAGSELLVTTTQEQMVL